MSDIEADLTAISRIAAVPTILEVVCRTTGMGFAAVARVTEERWIACSVKDDIAFGLKPGDELKIETTICHEIRQSGKPVIIDHVAENGTYSSHPTPALYGFQSYISMPIILQDGRFFGTLCAIDPRPAVLETPEVIGMFKLFAELIAFHLDAIESVNSSEAVLSDERKVSELREEFIAVLGHDLRNPPASIEAGARLLSRAPLNDKAKQVVGLIQNATARMSGLIDDVLDFARGRLGGGVTLDREASVPLEPILQQIIDELRLSWPDRMIETNFTISDPIDCDRSRIAQLLSNLVGNALSYGQPGMPIQVGARVEKNQFILDVANHGVPIPDAAKERMFQPFSRGEVRPNQKGLGLGLYIAAEIARSHGGTLGVVSTADETRFIFAMPMT